jgi:hypothetical protein
METRKEGRRTTLRLSPSLEKAVQLWRSFSGPASDQEAVTALMLRGAETVERERVLANRISARWQAWQGQMSREADGSPSVDEISDEDWAQAVMAYRGGQPQAQD